MKKITILYLADNISLFYTLYPFFLPKYSQSFDFTNNINYCLRNDHNKILLIIRYFKYRYDKVDENRQLIESLKNRYQKVFYFDDGDGADSVHGELLDLFDGYFKKQLLVDKDQYLRPMYGRQLFSDFYYQHMGVKDENESANIRLPIDSAHLSKLYLAWNLGIGHYPLSNIKRAVFLGMEKIFPLKLLSRPLAPSPQVQNSSLKRKLVHARFSEKPYIPSIGHQRKLLAQKVKNHPLFAFGKIPPSEYQRELPTLKAVLAPFGWGEICYRDFEAILNHSLLIKPCMDSVETWPSIFIKNETYLSIKWDGSDLYEKAEQSLDDSIKNRQIIKNAMEILSYSYSELPQQVEKLLNIIHL